LPADESHGFDVIMLHAVPPALLRKEELDLYLDHEREGYVPATDVLNEPFLHPWNKDTLPQDISTAAVGANRPRNKNTS